MLLRSRQVAELRLHPLENLLITCPLVLPEKGEHRLAVADVAACSVVIELASRLPLFQKAVQQALVSEARFGRIFTIAWR